MKPVDILTSTKAVLENEGWTQENFHDANGYCILGAFNKSFNDLEGTPDDYGTYCEATKYASDCCGERYGIFSLIGWNDGAGRTKEDVLNLLDCAIDRANKKPQPFG